MSRQEPAVYVSEVGGWACATCGAFGSAYTWDAEAQRAAREHVCEPEDDS